MVDVKTYHLSPTKTIPNSPFPLIVYRGLLKEASARTPVQVWDKFTSNGWEPQWIFRYGPNQASHYHSKTHECMAVLSGKATIRFGVADVLPQGHDLAGESTFSDEDGKPVASNGAGQAEWDKVTSEPGGVDIEAEAGDVFIIPAGVSHKTHNTSPEAGLMLLTPGDGHEISADNKRQTLSEIKLSGFTMLGAYPKGGVWNYAVGGEDTGNYEDVWSIPKPEKDPVLGTSTEGLVGQWKNHAPTKPKHSRRVSKL